MEERNWYNWRVSSTFWNLVRPMIKMAQENGKDIGFQYQVSECYDKLDLAMFLTKMEYIKMDSALRSIGSILDELLPINP